MGENDRRDANSAWTSLPTRPGQSGGETAYYTRIITARQIHLQYVCLPCGPWVLLLIQAICAVQPLCKVDSVPFFIASTHHAATHVCWSLGSSEDLGKIAHPLT